MWLSNFVLQRKRMSFWWKRIYKSLIFYLHRNFFQPTSLRQATVQQKSFLTSVQDVDWLLENIWRLRDWTTSQSKEAALIFGNLGAFLHKIHVLSQNVFKKAAIIKIGLSFLKEQCLKIWPLKAKPNLSMVIHKLIRCLYVFS